MFIFKNYLFWQIALVSLLLDRLTKLWIVTHFQLANPPQTVPLWSGVFHFTYVVNPGASFSFCAHCSGPFAGLCNVCRTSLPWLSLIVSLGLLGLGILGPRFSRWEQAAYGFLLGGAAGNGIDRFVAGKVVDFLDFRLINFPIFNLADIFINIGIVCLLWTAWHGQEKRQEKDSSSKRERSQE